MALVATVSCTTNNVFMNSAIITYYCTGHQKPSNSIVTSSSTRKTEYTNYSLRWTFTPGNYTSSTASSTITISGLAAGSAVKITGSLTVSYYKKVSTRTYNEEKQEWNSWKTDYESSKTITLTDSDTVTVYTRPGTFTEFSNITAGTTYISDILTTKNVTAWCNHCNKYLSWKNQTTSTAANACKVNKNDFITATWYNKCAETCGISTRVSNDPTKSNSLITAECIKALGTAISSYP